MTYDEVIDATPREKKIALWLAAGIHIAFVLLLILGVSWQRRQAEPAVAELWGNLSPPKAEAPPPPPPPAPKVERKPEARPEPKPLPKPEAKPIPKPEAKPVPKADIALKEKQEKERKLKEQRELEKQKEEEKRKLKAQEQEARKKEEEKKRQEKERIAREADEKRLAQEKQAMAERIAKEQAAAQRALNDKYIALIQNHVRRHIVEPPNLQGNPEVEFDVVLIPGGEVLSARMTRSSGVPAYDSAVERAILKASPLPLPPDPTLFQQFRELHLKIRPK